MEGHPNSELVEPKYAIQILPYKVSQVLRRAWGQRLIFLVNGGSEVKLYGRKQEWIGTV